MKIKGLSKIVALIMMGVFTTACEDVHKQMTVKEVYLPLGEDDSGCMRYRLQSTTQMSVQVVLYKTASGHFTPNKDNSNCR